MLKPEVAENGKLFDEFSRLRDEILVDYSSYERFCETKVGFYFAFFFVLN